METCYEPMADGGVGTADATATPGGWRELLARWQELREQVDSEWNAAYEALRSPGTEPARKWLGWALYRLAARVNPEITD